MRLISQNGEIDIPYENSVVYASADYRYNKEKKHHDIIGYRIIASIGDGNLILGVYSTKEKALKVMEMLHQLYMCHLTTVLFDVKAKTTYFKFPTDEEELRMIG